MRLKLFVALILFTLLGSSECLNWFGESYYKSPFAPVNSAFEPVRQTLTTMVKKFRDTFNQVTRGLRLTRNFYIEKSQSGKVKMIEVVSPPQIIGSANQVISCYIYGQASVIENRLSQYPAIEPKYVGHSEMQSVMGSCQNYFTEQLKSLISKASGGVESNNNSSENNGEGGAHFLEGIAIYPGTKWCGPGDIADNYEDLGTEADVDSCCREHDHCDDNMLTGETKHGINNTNSYTSSSCLCDEKLYKCLQKAASFIGDQIGRTYFNVLQTQCFKKDHPIIGCEDEKGFVFNTVRKSCQSYILDETQPKIYQFFDAKFYEGQAGPLFKIPGVSTIVDPAISVVKNHTINGGLVGNLIG